MKEIINNKLYLKIILLITVIAVFIMKFVLIDGFGFLELFLHGI